jgi:hypothetical protein
MIEAEMMSTGARRILPPALFLAGFAEPPLAPLRTASADKRQTGKIHRRNN